MGDRQGVQEVWSVYAWEVGVGANAELGDEGVFVGADPGCDHKGRGY